MNSINAQGKTSSDSGSVTGLEKWSQRRQQRLNTEQSFREQRQGVAGALSPIPGSDSQSSFFQQVLSNTYASQSDTAQPQQQARSGQPPNNNSAHSRSTNNNYTHDPTAQQQQQQSQYPLPDAVSQYQAHHNNRATIQSTRSYQSGNAAIDSDSMSVSNSNGAAKASRGGPVNRQSVHTDLLTRDSANQQGVPAFNAAVIPPVSQGSMFNSDSSLQQNNQQGQADPRRPTPQPLPTSEDMSEEEVNQLIKDHKELRT